MQDSSWISEAEGSYRRVAGLHVLRLRGSHYEMGRQHGALLREAIPRGPIPYYRDYVGKLVRQVGLGVAAMPLWWLLRQTIGRSVAKAIPRFAEQAIRGMADGAGLPYEAVLEGCVMPDSLVWAASRMMDLSRSEDTVRYRLALELGCTSAIAWGGATADGKLLHARNFDYHGVARWPREAAVVFHEPDDGQRYVSISSAGVLLGGVTAMNESGLSLTVHQHMFSNGTKLGGMPIGILGDVIMREARNLEDAARILDAHKHIGCWTYLVTDGKTREVLCHEQNPDRRVGRRVGERESVFAYANVYLDPKLASTERDLYGSYWRANVGRHRRAGALLAKGHGRLDPESMAAILADTGEGDCRLRQAIAMLLTVGSVVFRPEDGVVWVATGEAPTSHHAFEPFSLTTRDHAPELGRLTSAIPADRDAAAAFDAYREAYVAYFDRRDPQDARRLLGTAVRLRPEEAVYQNLDGLLALVTGSPSDAEAAFTRALARGHADGERVAAFHLWRGRARDLLGRREEARADYASARDAVRVDRRVRAAAERNLQKAFTRREARRVNVDFAYGDVIAP